MIQVTGDSFAARYVFHVIYAALAAQKNENGLFAMAMATQTTLLYRQIGGDY